MSLILDRGLEIKIINKNRESWKVNAEIDKIVDENIEAGVQNAYMSRLIEKNVNYEVLGYSYLQIIILWESLFWACDSSKLYSKSYCR